ncbi:MAG: hypothetical protein ACRD39_04195 [Nitrososphaeraceae archaeon]
MALLTRSTPGTKLLARYEHDNATFPFALADWLTPDDVTIANSFGKLQIRYGTSPDVNWRDVVNTAVASRSKRMVYAHVLAELGGDLNGSRGVSAHVTDQTNGSIDSVQCASTIGLGASEFARLEEWINGAATRDTEPVAAKTSSVVYPFSLFVDEAFAAGYDHTGNALVSKALTHTAGQAGIASTNGDLENWGYVYRYFDCPDRYVYVNGLPPGSSAQVLNASNAVLASANTVDGVAIIDMLQVLLEEATQLVVLDSADVQLASYAPAGDEIIEPGETYDLVSAFISPTSADLVSGVWPVQFEEVLGADYHQLDYWDGSNWSLLADNLLAAAGVVTYDWDASDIPFQTDAQLRARGVFIVDP